MKFKIKKPTDEYIEIDTEQKLNVFINMDCLEALKQMPDKCVDLVIADPPYGLGDRLIQGGGDNPMEKYIEDYKSKRWDEKPSKEYFDELFRVSKNQIIFGGNYFELPPTRGIICWDKHQCMPKFSRWEYAWTSFDKPAKLFDCRSQNKERFHPTQKPVSLYVWILKQFAKEGDLIMDTHAGSAPSITACNSLGYSYIVFEINEDYYTKAKEKTDIEKNQISFFDEPDEEIYEQSVLFGNED